ncbi:hypothetical protein IV417_02875 [Alphaproteobacteria bacterium KMM 3653]|uniref:YARHG domain-containing protein n=1 Tax=Harenicola maris TaxID=2841044 RepID=A0AAP2CKX7_9RHOB|nr:hypothetical protein [Harenicola maris]
MNLAAAITLGAFAASPAMGFDLARCARDVSGIGYNSEEDHRDHGGGVVTYVAKTCINGDCIRASLVVGCGSGKMVSAVSACEEVEPGFCSGKTRAMDAADLVHPALLGMVNSDEALTMEDVARRLKSKALRVSSATLDREVCACRAAYPGLRNGKTRFRLGAGQ